MYYSHLINIKKIVDTYRQQQPLSLFLKSFFRANKKIGSRDRKNIAQHVYNYFRLGNALPEADFFVRLQLAGYIVDNIIIDEKLNEEKHLEGDDNLENRITTIKNQFPGFNEDDIFPFTDELSTGIDKTAFAKSILNRPKVFIRIRKGFEEKVKQELLQKEFKFEIITGNTFSFEQEIKITRTQSFEKGWFEIQDLSSQQTGFIFEAKPNEYWWDCCAGAGGKSLLFKDNFPDTYVLLTDIRESILANASERMKKAGAKNYEIRHLETWEFGKPEIARKNLDVTITPLGFRGQFDGIIVDAPCSGSGTWARTPENISFFRKEMIIEFQVKQLAILENALQYLKPGGQLIYITCSAFKKENEEVTQHLLKTANLKLVREQLILGYENYADVMYAAQLQKLN